MRYPAPAPASRGKSTSTATPCCSKVGIKRGPWTPEEDEVLASYVRREGEGRWRTLPKRAGLQRCGKSCRLRWMNYLRPSVKRGQIAPDEEDLILRLHRLLGNRYPRPRAKFRLILQYQWKKPATKMMMMNSFGQNYADHNCNNEDIFSSFLDSLVEDEYTNQYHRGLTAAVPAQFAPGVSFTSAPSFNHGNVTCKLSIRIK